jgi:hypothetical protein
MLQFHDLDEQCLKRKALRGGNVSLAVYSHNLILKMKKFSLLEHKAASRFLLAACFTLLFCLAYCSALMMQETCFSEMSVDLQRTMCPRRYVLKTTATRALKPTRTLKTLE